MNIMPKHNPRQNRIDVNPVHVLAFAASSSSPALGFETSNYIIISRFQVAPLSVPYRLRV